MGTPSVLEVAGCVVPAVVLAVAVAGCRALWRWSRARRRGFGTPADDATFATLHTISCASSPLRAGLTPESARKAARPLRMLLGAEALALVTASSADVDGAEPSGPSGASEPSEQGGPAAPGGTGEPQGRLLVWDGAGEDPHARSVLLHAQQVLATGRPRVVNPDLVACGDPLCRIRVATLAPLSVEGRVEGVLAVYGPGSCGARVQAVGEVALWVSGQLELAELDCSRARLAEAEMRALRAQISPHFVYNSLTTIASFVRTDPVRARELLLDFADFARYSFRNPRDFTTLADELRCIDRYLLLERARFGDRLQFSVEVAPEVLPVAVPFLSLQPLVENAIRHGMEGAQAAFHIKIVARDSGADAAISVADDGVGMEPGRLAEILAAGTAGGERRGAGAGIGLANVDERMRQVYGEEYGLTVETAPGQGAKVNLRVPKYRPGVLPR